MPHTIGTPEYVKWAKQGERNYNNEAVEETLAELCFNYGYDSPYQMKDILNQMLNRVDKFFAECEVE